MTKMDFGATLAPIRARFLDLLEQRQEEIERNLYVALEDPDSAEGALTCITNILHKIAGSAGTLGFTELGDRARAIEYRLTMTSDGKVQHHQSVYMEIVDFLENSMDLTKATA